MDEFNEFDIPALPPRESLDDAGFGGSINDVPFDVPCKEEKYQDYEGQINDASSTSEKKKFSESTKKFRNSLSGNMIYLYTIYNPKSATLSFVVGPTTGNLGIKIAPAIPGNPAINARGPVPKGTKVYDYSKEVFSVFNETDVVDFIFFLETFFGNNSEAISWVANSNTILTNLDDYLRRSTAGNENANISRIIESISVIQSSMERIVPRMEPKFSLFRRSPSEGNKIWNFDVDENTGMLHVNCNISSKTNIRISLSRQMVFRVLFYLEGFVKNRGTNMMLAHIIKGQDSQGSAEKVNP